mmetsp:Transcript_1475/g.1991  ORF Transcript_1475/g.1991 Transcript_1475/m.1991 type:complete len:433 (+) Transcript_1475:126-1424(+)|eukprot:CAMPEP_0178894436 /NCGR_PEP_ID=MMETSP0786-20121207/10_1 /TAXON_ID=186022 /ORGANISM="Thalassionema frauenfeldii, Strain CCMP 1798" /LENGTH=432 /DNA_ID=CAMNT_0020564515 /DNA_START=23 /DNA_END=1321 /DNA_ORIENTATION=-
MKLSFALILTLYPLVSGQEFGELPPGVSVDGAVEAWASFVEGAFPTWCIDGDENRLYDLETCSDGTKNGRYDPLYLTKWHGGEDPALGGYPTDVDTKYPFYYASGFFGQACAGGNAHCSFDFDGGKNNCAKCGKIVTLDDGGPNGPGHVPPHIGLASLTRAYYDGGFGDVADWFDYAQNGCRVLPHVLLSMIRTYFPRDPDGSAKYPPPFTADGGVGGDDGVYAYPLEFVNLVGDSCANEQTKFPTAECYEQHSSGTIDDYPDYLEPGHGSPHYCSVGAMAADVNKDWCPYLYFGPNRGKYRHPHIAYAAVEVWLANKVMPDECGETWDHNDGKDYPFTPDHSVAFPKMASVPGHEDDPKQPALNMDGGFIWPGDEGRKRKAVKGVFVLDKFLTPTTIGEPMDPTLLTDLDDLDDSGEPKRLKKGSKKATRN